MADSFPGRVAKKGRRANQSPGDDLNSFDDSLGTTQPGFNTVETNNVETENEGFNRPSESGERPSVKNKGGWANDSPWEKRKGVSKKKSGTGDTEISSMEEDERLNSDHQVTTEDSNDEIPVIPDLDDFQEEDLANKIAAPPSVQVNRVATYRELDNDFQKHSYLLTLDNEIDLKLLGKVLAPESAIHEEDKPWDWDRLFTEISSELQTEWENMKTNEDSTTSQAATTD